jgi:uncharacterized protein with NRDE domain
MCTVILLRRPGHAWPLLLAANRDERLDRAWDPPKAWWPQAPGVIGGRDRLGGGTWMALGPHRVVVAILNRPGSLGPEEGKRSRGEIPLGLAVASSAAAAAERACRLRASEWRAFHAVIADPHQAFFVRSLGRGQPEARQLPDGYTMVTAHEPNDPASPRIRRHLPRFRAAPPPDPERDDWASWAALLADSDHDPLIGRAEALNVPPTDGFGTVSSSLLALDALGGVRWLFCPGPPDSAAFYPVPLNQCA